MAKKHVNGFQYTLRSVPRAVDRALRRRAREEGKSLNQVAIEALVSATGIPGEKPVYTDLDHLIGTWVEDPAFEEALAAQDSVDPELWK